MRTIYNILTALFMLFALYNMATMFAINMGMMSASAIQLSQVADVATASFVGAIAFAVLRVASTTDDIHDNAIDNVRNIINAIRDRK